MICSICDKPITQNEQRDIHSDLDGGDCHEACCPVCNSCSYYMVTVGEVSVEADLGALTAAVDHIGDSVPGSGAWRILFDFAREILDAAIEDQGDKSLTEA